MNCKICDASTVELGQALVLGKHSVCYFRCPKCGFVQPETPHWLPEAYSDAITSSDLGYVSRNLDMAWRTRALIPAFFNPGSRFLDYGGGYGMLVRLMRDAGYDFYRSDKFCNNLFATGFDATQGMGNFELLTAFEVFEHLEDPRADLEAMLAQSSSIFFSTELLPSPPTLPPSLKDWWYYGLEHGQHVALYSRRALEVLAERFGLRLLSDNRSLHLLTRKTMSERLYRLALRRAGSRFLNWFGRRPSLLPVDFEHHTGHRLPGAFPSTARA